MGLGFTAFGLFLAFAIIKIILDEAKRHSTYSKNVAAALDKLQSKLGQTKEDMDRLDREFEDYEARGGKPIENDDDANLIN